jgi:hypothetical protein
MQFKTIVAAFFLRKGPGNCPTLQELVRTAGMTRVESLEAIERRALGIHDPAREVVGGTWGAFGDTWAVLDETEGLACVQLYASMNGYLDAQLKADDSRSEAPVLAYIATFRDACLSLKPVAALFDTRSHYGDERWENQQGNRDWVLAQSHLIAASDVDGLADEWYSLLYLSEPLARLWHSNPLRDDRDRIDIPGGRLVFAGSGRARLS